MTRVLQFPTPCATNDGARVTAALPMHRCVGGCDAVVSSPNALCLSCAAQ